MTFKMLVIGEPGGSSPAGLVVFREQETSQLLSLTPQSASLHKLKKEVFVLALPLPHRFGPKPFRWAEHDRLGWGGELW